MYHKINIAALAFQCLLFTSLSVQADSQHASLLIPEELDILTINNKKYTSRKLFSDGEQNIRLAPGQHSIVVEYDIIWDTSADDHERVQSKPFQITFNAEAAKQYYIKLPEFAHVENAQKYANRPVVKLVNRITNKRISIKVSYLDVEQSIFKQFNQPIAPATSTQAAASITPVNSATRTNITPPKQEEYTNSGGMPLKMLKYWWKQANKEQRAKFLRSME